MDNRLTEARQHLSQTSDGWAYDSLYRLADQERDLPQGGGTPKERRAWTLDGAQNWARLAITPASGGTQTFTQTMDPLNSYTRFQDKVQADDFNGNRKDDGRFLYRWDFLDRGRQVSCKAGGEPVSTHLYDAWGANGHLNGSGRRVRKTVTRDRHGCSGSFEAPEGGDEDDDTEEPHAPGQGCPRRKAADIRFLWDGWSLVEERDAATLKVLRQYVDMGMDRHLAMDDYKKNGKLKRTLFYHEDAKGWVAALTDKQGHVRERYAYDAYGMPTFLDGHGRARHDQRESRFGNPHLYNGCYFDSETRLYPMRHRVYSPGQGRFLSRDPIGIWGDGVGSGNGYAYVGGNSPNLRDPLGLRSLWAGQPCSPECSTKDEEVREGPGHEAKGELISSRKAPEGLLYYSTDKEGKIVQTGSYLETWRYYWEQKYRVYHLICYCGRWRSTGSTTHITLTNPRDKLEIGKTKKEALQDILRVFFSVPLLKGPAADVIGTITPEFLKRQVTVNPYIPKPYNPAVGGVL